MNTSENGGDAVVLWLQHIFNAIIGLDDTVISPCFKLGITITVFKGKGYEKLTSVTYTTIEELFSSLSSPCTSKLFS